jgi:hypothetical protein
MDFNDGGRIEYRCIDNREWNKNSLFFEFFTVYNFNRILSSRVEQDDVVIFYKIGGQIRWY